MFDHNVISESENAIDKLSSELESKKQELANETAKFKVKETSLQQDIGKAETELQKASTDFNTLVATEMQKVKEKVAKALASQNA